MHVQIWCFWAHIIPSKLSPFYEVNIYILFSSRLITLVYKEFLTPFVAGKQIGLVSARNIPTTPKKSIDAIITCSLIVL